MTVSIRWIARVVTVEKAFILPIIFVCCVIGAYALSNRMYDVWVVLAFGVIGFLLDRAKVPLGPFVIGFVLSGIFEAELRSSLQMSDNGILGILERPIAMTFVLISVVMLLWPFVQTWRARRQRLPLETPS